MKRLFLLVVALLAAGAFAATVLADTTPPGTTTDTTTTAPTPSTVPLGVMLAGVQIGGLTPEAAVEAVTAAFNAPVSLRFGATRITVAPSLLGLRVPVDSAVAKALTVAPNTQLAPAAPWTARSCGRSSRRSVHASRANRCRPSLCSATSSRT